MIFAIILSLLASSGFILSGMLGGTWVGLIIMLVSTVAQLLSLLVANETGEN